MALLAQGGKGGGMGLIGKPREGGSRSLPGETQRRLFVELPGATRAIEKNALAYLVVTRHHRK